MKSNLSRPLSSTLALFVVCLVLFGCIQVQAAVPDGETQNIVTEISSAISPLQRLWNVSNIENLCSFQGISCVNGSIYKIEFSNLGLVGLLPSSVFMLKNLTKIDMSGNRILIPNSIQGVSSPLKYVTWSRSWLNTTFPRIFCEFPTLIELDLSQNNLTGPIPPCVANLTNLEDLALDSNFLEGPLPDLSSLVEIRNFSIGSNRIMSPFPDFVCGWPNVEVLHLGPNGLSTNPPPCVGNLLNLTRLVVIRPASTGTSATSMPSLQRLQRLKQLVLVGQGFNSAFPDWVASLSLLQHLDLSKNQLEGPLPDLATLRFLRVLRLDYNRLNGSIPLSLMSMGTFDVLSLSFNQFTGPFPSGLLSRVTNMLILASNQLQGCISDNQTDVSVLFCDATGNQGLCGCSVRICGIPACSGPPISSSLPPRSIFAPVAPIGAAPIQATPPATNSFDPMNLVLVTPTSITGDLRLNHSATVTIHLSAMSTLSYREPILRVFGCVSFAGVLVVNAPVTIAGAGERTLITFQRYCDGFPRTFAYVKSSFDGLDCTNGVAARTIYEPRSVAVDFAAPRYVCET